jgi:hypothetical protein
MRRSLMVGWRTGRESSCGLVDEAFGAIAPAEAHGVLGGFRFSILIKTHLSLT